MSEDTPDSGVGRPGRRRHAASAADISTRIATRRAENFARPPREKVPRGFTTKQWIGRFLADFGGWLATRLPLAFGYRLADLAGDLLYRYASGYRANVIDNLRHVVGSGTDLDELRRMARKTFRNSARNFYDLLRVRRLPSAELERSIVLIGSWDTVDRAIEQGRGVIFVTGHVGAFDYAAQLIPLHGYHCVLVTVRTVSEFMHDIVTYLRASKGFELEEPSAGGLRRLMRALRQGRAIGLASDRDFLRNGTPVQFFGHQTTLPVGAARLALETGAAVVTVICRRHRTRQTFTIEEPIWLERTGDPDADLAQGVQQVASILERHIRPSPEQWVMFQRVWPETPAPAIAVFPVGSPLEGRLLGGEASSRAGLPPAPRP